MHEDPLKPIPNTSQDSFLCAVCGSKDLQSDEVCEYHQTRGLKIESRSSIDVGLS